LEKAEIVYFGMTSRYLLGSLVACIKKLLL